MKNIPTKPELEKLLNALRNEFNFADEGGMERISRSIRLIETALLELASKETEKNRRKSEEQKEAQKEHARQFVREATEHGHRITAAIADLIGSFATYKSMMIGAVQACPSLKNGSIDTLLSERELLKAIAAEILRRGLKLPQGGFNATDEKSLSDKVRMTERSQLGMIDNFSALYEVASELESL